MNSSSQSPQGLRFGIFEIDLDARELRKNGLRVKLQEQPFKILAVMVRRAGEVITRDELYAELSSHKTYDFKHGLNNAIQKIRDVLGDSPENARFIETVPGRGYRFLPQVEGVYKPSVRYAKQISAVEKRLADVPDVEPQTEVVADVVTAPEIAPNSDIKPLPDPVRIPDTLPVPSISLAIPILKADTAGTGRLRWRLWTGIAALLIVAGLSAYFYVRRDSTTSNSTPPNAGPGNNNPSPSVRSSKSNPPPNASPDNSDPANAIPSNSDLRSAWSKDSKVMLVVLPFVNINGGRDQEYIADGMTEEMITQLSRLNPKVVGVIARTKVAHKDAPQIGRELRADYLLEGSVRREGNRIRVTALLIQAEDQTYIWAESYDRDLSNVLKMQSDVAHAIAGELQIELAKPRQVIFHYAPPRVNLEARSAYFEGMKALTWRTKEGCEIAIADFKQSIAIDADYGPAYTGLARAYNLAPVFGALTPAQAFPQAAAAATYAVSMDPMDIAFSVAVMNPTNSDAHSALGFTKVHWEFDWPGAEREFRKAIDHYRKSATAHLYYSHSYLTPIGRHDEAIAEMKKALKLDPLSLPIQSSLGRTYVLARRYADALAQFKRTADMDPNFAINHQRLAHLYAHLRRYPDAIAEETKARLESGEGLEKARAHRRALTQAFESSGARGYWQEELKFAEEKQNPPDAYVTPIGRAIIYSELGNKDEALRWLEKAYVERDIYVTEIAVTAEFDFLRQEPRFQSLLQRIGLAK